MTLRDKAFIAITMGVLVVAISSHILELDNTRTGYVNVTLLTNAGVMIETTDTRIYIDPIELPQDYQAYPADAILITHNHGDHYQYTTINMLEKEDTMIVLPAMMTTEINLNHAEAVTPGDELSLGDITIKAFYMYTFSPDGSTASHPASSQFTSYIIDIHGFTLFHAGDSKNIPEYSELTDTIDVAMLPLGPGCQTMCDTEVVDVVKVIKPEYVIPIHYTDDSFRRFNSIYRRQVEAQECTVCSLEAYTSCKFEIE